MLAAAIRRAARWPASIAGQCGTANQRSCSPASSPSASPLDNAGGSWHPACPGGRDVVDRRACLLERDDHGGEDVGGEVELGLGGLVELGGRLGWGGHPQGTEGRPEVPDRGGGAGGGGH